MAPGLTPHGRHVTRAELRALHQRVREHAPIGAAGVFGPGGAVWDLASESVCFAAGGRAALMQAALPAVARSIVDHSPVVSAGDVAGRFKRTFEHVFGIVFGTLDQALASSERVWGIHERIVGDGYHANNPHSLLWVHATLMDSAILAHETFVGPMPTARKEAYYAESKRFAWLFGIGDDVLPSDWRAFRGYMAEMLAGADLSVTPAARVIHDGLFVPSSPALAPVWNAYRTMTTALMPPRLRRDFDLAWGPRERLGWRALRRTLCAAYRAAPDAARKLPAYLDARRRLAGVPGRDRLGVAKDRLIMSLL